MDLEREVNRVGVRVRVELDLNERQIFQQPAFTFYDFVVQVPRQKPGTSWAKVAKHSHIRVRACRAIFFFRRRPPEPRLCSAYEAVFRCTRREAKDDP